MGRVRCTEFEFLFFYLCLHVAPKRLGHCLVRARQEDGGRLLSTPHVATQPRLEDNTCDHSSAVVVSPSRVDCRVCTRV